VKTKQIENSEMGHLSPSAMCEFLTKKKRYTPYGNQVCDAGKASTRNTKV